MLRSDQLEEIRHHPDWLNVSRETFVKLERFLDLVTKWNSTINLVSVGSVGQAWTRHLLDSAQLWSLAPLRGGIWLDIGSGGGFPGMVISILAQEAAPDLGVVLVESDRRKSVFLREAVRQLQVSAEVHCKRIEDLPPMGANVVTARALAPLCVLLSMVTPHLAPDGVVLFPKGQNHAAELEHCRALWTMKSDVVSSKTDPDGVILRIRALQHA